MKILCTKKYTLIECCRETYESMTKTIIWCSVIVCLIMCVNVLCVDCVCFGICSSIYLPCAYSISNRRQGQWNENTHFYRFRFTYWSNEFLTSTTNHCVDTPFFQFMSICIRAASQYDESCHRSICYFSIKMKIKNSLLRIVNDIRPYVTYASACMCVIGDWRNVSSPITE